MRCTMALKHQSWGVKMARFKFKFKLLSSSALAGSTLATLLAAGTQANAAACSSPFVKGDVFASVGSGTVNVYTPTGTLVCNLNDGTSAQFTTGSGFDSTGNFYVT